MSSRPPRHRTAVGVFVSRGGGGKNWDSASPPETRRHRVMPPHNLGFLEFDRLGRRRPAGKTPEIVRMGWLFCRLVCAICWASIRACGMAREKLELSDAQKNHRRSRPPCRPWGRGRSDPKTTAADLNAFSHGVKIFPSTTQPFSRVLSYALCRLPHRHAHRHQDHGNGAPCW